LSFAPDQTTRTFTVLIFGDITYEPNETFHVILYGASGASFGRSMATGTILNDDIGVFTPAPTYIPESFTYADTGSFTDPLGTSWTATVNYGDGSATQPLALNPDHSFNLNHFYASSGDYALVVTVKNNLGTSGTGWARVIEYNVAPTVNAGPDQAVNEG